MRALVLSGGGSKGAFQIGVLKYLLGELSTSYDIFAGISVGAINSAFLAQYPAGDESVSYEDLKSIWDTVDNSSIFKTRYNVLPDILSMAFSAITSKSLYDSSPLQELISDNLVTSMVNTSGKLLRVGAVSLNTTKKRYWTETSEDLIDGVIASSAFPGFFNPVEIDGQLWTDGGVRDIAPVFEAMQAGATEIDIITTSPLTPSHFPAQKKNVLSSFVRYIDIMSEEILENDIVYAAGVDDISLRIFRPKKLIQPDSLNFDPHFIQKNIEHGFDVAVTRVGA